VTTPDPQQLRKLADILERRNDRGDPALLSRAWDWSAPPRQGDGHRFTRGGGLTDPEGDPDNNPRNEDRQVDARVAGYYDELTAALGKAAKGVTEALNLAAMILPDPVQKITTKDMQSAQLAADGWCISCARDRNEGLPHLRPVASGRYADRCRFCGEWKRDHGQDPPIELVKARNLGHTIRTRTA
jgi:hypothetical protein